MRSVSLSENSQHPMAHNIMLDPACCYAHILPFFARKPSPQSPQSRQSMASVHRCHKDPTATARHFQEGTANNPPYSIAAHKVWRGWNPMPQRPGSKIGSASRWSKSMSIVPSIMTPAFHQFSFQNIFPKTKGTIR